MKFNLFSLLILVISIGLTTCSLYANDQGNFTGAEISLIQNIIGAAEDEHGPNNYDGIGEVTA